MNEHQAATVARLRAAGLLEIAERAARKVDLRLADCIAPGEVTGGHLTLWRALGRPPEEVARLVGFPVDTVREAMRPTLRLVKPPPKPREPKALTVWMARIEALEARVRDLESAVPEATPSGRVLVSKRAQAVLDAVCEAHGLAFAELVGSARSKEHSSARGDASRRLKRLGLSVSAIGRILRRDHTTILYLLGKRGAGRKAAA